ncbi:MULTISPECIES: AIPR family protein [unclassified Psychrobacter]|uniref:AIPR family protein n=14 Tax=Psychrobacter TaxID=497 RepID=UPI0017878286|nr:AIPR family protein [Psychrobacter sp. FME13]MBE0441006.1 AIPR family protein [Psychrobacter sp. FME13]
MSDIVQQYIDITREELFASKNKIDITLSDELLFGTICYKYFYNEGRFDITDFKNSYTDGANDGGVDLIAVNEGDIYKSLVLIQSKNVKNFNSKDEIKDIFTKMAQTVKDFRNDKVGSYNKNLRRIYREKYDDAVEDENFSIELVLFINTNKSEEYRDEISLHLKKIEELEDFELSIFYKNEVEQQIKNFENGQRYVREGRVDIYKDHGFIKNGENGLLVNISALSVRKLYDKYRDEGLFEQNFRYFVRNKKIDDQINSSLKKKRDKFWFLNNGIIIGCKDFHLDGDNIKLEDFSIINGCQTTTILGSYKGSNEDLDFPISCKIVKPDHGGEDYFNVFISEIAEASNSQKPISDRDLKSNYPEQRNLQLELKAQDPKIYLEIKRGEGILRKRNLQSWQKIKNDSLGQLILSVLLQRPGTARSNKKKIFSDRGTYNSIFKRTHDKDTIVDLLQLANYYDEFVKSSNLSEKPSNIAKNGRLCVLAIIGFIIKYNHQQIDIKLESSSAEWVSDLTSDTLTGPLFDKNRPDDYRHALNSLFNQIIMALLNLYTSRGDTETSVTNFFKTDKKYFSVILEFIKSSIILDEYEFHKVKEKMDKIFY